MLLPLRHNIVSHSRFSNQTLCQIGKTVEVIVNCFEVFLDRPSSLLARASTLVIVYTLQHYQSFTWNNIPLYPKHWEVYLSDKYLTESCGILRHLLPGEVVAICRPGIQYVR